MSIVSKDIHTRQCRCTVIATLPCYRHYAECVNRVNARNDTSAQVTSEAGYSTMRWRRNEYESVGAPVGRESGGGTDPAQSALIFLWSCPSTCFAFQVHLVVLVSAFVMVSTVWSVFVCCFLLTVPPPCAQPSVKVGDVPPVPYGVGDTATM